MFQFQNHQKQSWPRRLKLVVEQAYALLSPEGRKFYSPSEERAFRLYEEERRVATLRNTVTLVLR